MRITTNNLREIRKDCITIGIDKVQYGSTGELLYFTLKDGQQFECDPRDLDDLKRSGLVRMGRRIRK